MPLRRVPFLPDFRKTPVGVFATGIVATLLACLFVWWTTESGHRLQAQKQIMQVTQTIETRIEAHQAFMRAASALVAVGDLFSRDTFRAVVDVGNLSQRLPGLQAVGYAARVSMAEGVSTVDRLRVEGFPEFTIRPGGERAVYQVVIDIQSVDYRHRGLMGYDLLAHPSLRSAAELARDSGDLAATAFMPLVPDSKDSSSPKGVFLLAPIYQGQRRPDSIVERRSQLRGYVFSTIRVDDLVAGLVEIRNLEITEATLLDPAVLIHRSPEVRRNGPSVWWLSLEREIALGGRRWTLHYSHEADLVEKWPAPVVALLGLGASFILFRVSRFQLRARLAAEAAAAALRASQEALRASEAEAHAANRAKDAFLATLSHELRTPLNAILGWASMMRSGSLDAARQARALEVIDKNARFQARLIEDLFDVSRIISGKLVIERKLMEIEPVVMAALESLRPAADTKGVLLQYSVQADVAGVFVLADPARVQQVVWNLLSNAVKFTPEKGLASLDVRVQGDRVIITVSDSGIGIAPEFLPHVFERFRQADDTTTRKFGGMGLGLAIVQHLAQVHGGTVEARSEGAGRGAQFIVSLPIARRGTPGEAALDDALERYPVARAQ